MPGDCLTLLLQRAILGLEAYIPSAVHLELMSRKRLNGEVRNYLQNPFDLKGSSAADKYYNSLPALFDKQYQLRVCDKSIWEETKVFYKELRNPIFHGYEIDYKDFDGVRKAFHHINKLYRWVDSWHDFYAFLPFKRGPKQAVEGS
jgi:hypothetical protein